MGKTDMNVMTGTKVPALRFKGYNDEWVEKKLGDVLTSYPSRKHISDINCDDDAMYLEIQQGDSPKAGHSKGVPFEEFSEVILFGDHTLSLYSPDEPFVLSTDGLKILGSNSLDIDFLYEIININKPVSEGYKRHFSILRNRRVKYPISPNEQLQIGQTFKTVDALIQSEEQKLEQLQSLKKSFLQKMFPKKGVTVPELRFEGFDDEWVETQMLDEIRAYQPKTLPQSEFTGAGYPVYGANGIIGYTDKYNHDFEQIALACRGTVGSVIRTEKKSWINGNAMVLDVSDNDSVDFDFMYHLLGQYNFNRLATGSTQLQITRASLLGAKFYMPSLQEQQAIGQFFKTFDELIAKQEEKVENGKFMKKALLQKMFV